MTSNAIAPMTTVDALNKTLEAPPLDPVVLAIANDYLSGKSVEEMSEEYAVSQDRITSVIEKKEVKSYIDNVFATQGYLNRIKRINLDWMKHLHEVETALKPKTAGPQVAVQINNYDKLMKDLME